jgi:Domain of unknown function (DUF1835)./Protein of unknown function.
MNAALRDFVEAAREERMRNRRPLHLVQGDHAGDRLRTACRDFGLAGRVHVIGEDLSHGPLDDGPGRIAYMRRCYRGFDRWTFRRRDAFTPWRRLRKQAAGVSDPVLVWTAESVSDQIFLAMACHWLAGLDIELLAVTVPPVAGRYGVGVATPAMLVELRPRAVPLTAAERAGLAATFVALSGPDVRLRRLEDGVLRTVPPDSYDAFVGEALGHDWQPATEVVAAAMRRCDGHNRMSDLFFASRLQEMIDAGVVEMEGKREHLAAYRVRRAVVASGLSGS